MAPRRSLQLLMALFVLAQTLVQLELSVPGHFSIDEIGYHFMTRAVAEGDAWRIQNGFERYGSAELEVAPAETVVAVDGRLVGKYPYLLPRAAALLYPVFGFQALFFVNILAFSGTLWVLWKMSLEVLADDRWALLPPVLLTLCTYASEYAQAAWPHMLLAFLATSGSYCLLRGYASRRANTWFLFGGAALGLALGARFDAAFWAAGLFLTLALRRPFDARALVAFGLGFTPGIALLSFDNYYKLGTWHPFLYANAERNRFHIGVEFFIPAAVALLVLMLGVFAGRRWYLSKPKLSVAHKSRLQRLLVVAGIVAFVCALLFSARVRELGRGLAVLLVDLRWRPESAESLLSRDAGGALVYLGHYKQAFLQSCPFFVVCCIPQLWRAASASAASLMLLALPAAALIGAYSLSSWHGGLSFNLRYFVPALPSFVVLVVALLRGLLVRFSPALGAALGLAALAPVVLFLRDPTAVRFFVLDGSLLVAAALLLSIFLAWNFQRARSLPVVCFVLTLSWSAVTNLGYDYPASRNHRAQGKALSDAVLARMQPNALFFSSVWDPWGGLIDGGNILLAEPTQDNFRSFRRLVFHHLEEGKPVYAAFARDQWKALDKRGMLRGLGFSAQAPLGGFLFVRLVRERPSTLESDPHGHPF